MNKNKSVSEAQKRAYQKYIVGTDEIRIRAPKGTKQTIMEYLLRSGETMQEFVLRATCEMIEDDQIREEQYKRLCGYNEVYLNIRKKEQRKNRKTDDGGIDIRKDAQDEIIKNMIVAGYTVDQIMKIAPMYSHERIDELAASTNASVWNSIKQAR